MRLRPILALGALAGAAILAACQAAPTPAPATPAPGTTPGAAATPGGTPAAKATAAPAKPTGTLRAAIQSVQPSANPLAILNSGGPGTEVAYAIAEPLVAPNAQGDLVGLLAESWSVDGVNWTFRIRPNARFSNGQQVTANDVKFTYDTFADPANGFTVRTSFVPFTKDVRVVDASTIVFETTTPDAIFAKRLDRMLVVPAAAYNPQTFATNPIGSGPFQMQSFTPNSTAIVTANPHAWNQPRLERIEFRGVTDITTRTAALQTNEVDLASSLTPDAGRQLAAAGKKLETFSTGANVNIYLQTVGPDAGPMADIRVREAVNLALDRQTIIRALTGEIGRVSNQLVTVGVFGYDASLPAIPFDQARARQLVNEAGVAGTRVPMVGAFAVGTGLTNQDSAQAVAASIGQSGLVIEPQAVEAAVFTQRFSQGGLGPMGMASLPSGSDSEAALRWFRGAPALPPAAVRFQNAEYDRLYDQQQAEFNVQARERILQQMIKILRDNYVTAPYGAVPLVSANNGKIVDLVIVGAYRWDFAKVGITN